MVIAFSLRGLRMTPKYGASACTDRKVKKLLARTDFVYERIYANKCEERVFAAMGGTKAMPWEGTRAQDEQLWQALDEALNQQGWPAQRLAAAINSDRQALDVIKSWGDRRKSVIDDGTLTRWHTEGVAKVAGARAHKKQAIYEFFERTASPRTALYRPADGLPAGLASFAAQYSERIREPFAEDLSSLDGVYRMFRPAWTIPKLANERILISRFQIETSGGFTRFRERQLYHDPDSPNIFIDQTDDGGVMSMSGNFVFFGIGRDGHGCKLFTSWDYYPLPKRGVQVQRLVGSMMAINGNGPHLSYPFVATRTSDSWDDIDTGVFRPPHEDLTIDILDDLNYRT
ncbi:hypothetical protein [Roseovarius sp. MBR-6]|jgi:hypothetical protein|uniref:hypothetical protein n=1 Tax=Roseovarius sp. MBR-6 TaxID=3156459 RepID=UPI0033939ACA